MSTDPQQPEPLFTELSARRLGPVRSFFARQPVVMDVLIMVIFALPALVTSVSTALGDPEAGVSGPSSTDVMLGLSFVVLTTTALFWRRRRPVSTLVAVVTLTVLSTLTTNATNGLDLAVALCLYAVAAARPPGVTWTAFAASQIAVGAAVWFFDDTFVTAEPDISGDELSAPAARVVVLIMLALAALLAIAIGTSVRGRRQHIAELVARGNALARDRDQQAQLARATERSRIAREMHDVVSGCSTSPTPPSRRSPTPRTSRASSTASGPRA